MNKRRKQNGFTILELLVVVAIIAILAIIALPNFIGRVDEAKDSRELAEINSVTKAVATYYSDHGVYPTLQGKDGTLLQPQPIDGSPHNVDFSSLVPDYLATLPHFSYWWVDYQGNVYHTEKTIGVLAGNIFTPTAGYTYTLNKADGSKVALSTVYTVQVGEYVTGADEKGKALPSITTGFKNAKTHPESGEVVQPVNLVEHINVSNYTLKGASSKVSTPANTFIIPNISSALMFEPITSGKKYIEIDVVVSDFFLLGVTPTQAINSDGRYYTATNAVYLYCNNVVYASGTPTGKTLAVSKRIGILLDMTSKEVTFYTQSGSLTQSITGSTFYFSATGGATYGGPTVTVYTESKDFTLNPQY